MSLVDYRRKRHFSETPEPEGEAETSAEADLQFVIQKHAASHLHYDFRLELDGTLKSWAVPHGPCLDPSQKRLAVQVEDHPIAYGGFEGLIPQGQYGGGTVIIWDRGTWEPIGNPETGYSEGKLKFKLNGEKLHGGWTLVRMHFKSGKSSDKPNWLLIKERDEHATSVEELDILEERPESVASGKSIEELSGTAKARKDSDDAADHSTAKPVPKKPVSATAIRNSGTPRKTASKTSKSAHSTESAPAPKSSKAAKSTAKPSKGPTGSKADVLQNVEPQLATLVDSAPEGDKWLHETKFDGYRILCHVDNDKIVLRSRNQLDWTVRFPELAAALRTLKVRQAVLDGELVAFDSNGVTSFQELQMALTANNTSALKYYAFDLLYLDGYDLRELSLDERRQKLRGLLPAGHSTILCFAEEFDGTGSKAFERASEMGLEGIISKRRNEPYRSGRSGDWLKTKCSQRDEFVIGGFTDSTSARKKLGALLLGHFDADGHLKFAGKVGTGFSEQTLRDLYETLAPLQQKANPFGTQEITGTKRGIHWVKPKIVAQIVYSNWTRDGRLRHPTFQGLREDKAASAVIRDEPVELAAVTSDAENGESKSTRSRPSTPHQNGKTSKPAKDNRSTAVKKASEDGQVEITHPERVVYPSVGITKLDVATYYAQIAPWILPHVQNRPLSLLRCPQGQGGPVFFQKHLKIGVPAAIEQVLVTEKNKSDYYPTIHDLAGLTALVQMGVLEIHPWGSQADSLERPDRMIFDLDPDPSVGWPEVVKAAKELRQRLKDLKLESFVKTSGGKGLHVVLPFARRHDWPEFKEFSKAIATQMASDAPDRFTSVMSKASRQGKIFVDYLRNDRGSTAIAPYSTRAREGATVATTLSWDELSPKVKPAAFHLGTIPDRLTSLKADPWIEIWSIRQSITTQIKTQIGMK
jgi:bifunctional non-homologous end joining protein LigD